MKHEIIPAQSTVLATTTNADASFIEAFLSEKSAGTRATYEHSIRLFFEFIGKPLQSAVRKDATAYRDWLKTKYASAHSVKLHVNVVKSLFSFGVATNYLATNVFAAIKTASTSELVERILDEEDVLKLISAPAKKRDQLILRLLYAAGLRVSELCALKWADLKDDKGQGVLHVTHGKGDKERFVTLSDATYKRLKEYAGAFGQPADDYIFRSQVTTRAGVAHDGQLTRNTVHTIVKAAALRAGVDASVSAHWLRHSHASHAIDRGAKMVTVRDTLGHASIATTNKYLHGKRGESSALSLAV